MKKELTAIMMAAVLSPALSAAPQLPAAEPLRHNIETTVDLGVGLWGIPLPVDYNGDGVNDLLVSCPDTPYKGIYYFRNIGTNSKPLFDRAEKLYHKAPNNIRVSYYGGKPHVLAKDTEYENFFGSFLDEPRTISYEGPVLGEGWNKSRSNMWNYADWDGDGDADIIVGIDTWDDYGWDNAYNSEGVWQNGPIHGYLYLLENVEGRYVNRGRMLAGGAEIDTFGAPCPCIADFDSDGDLDIICGEFRDRLTWFENRDGSLLAGKPLANKSGEIRFHVEMIVPVPFDFDKDGRVDLLVSDEDGSVCFVRNTGKVRKGMPQFADPVRLQQKADLVKFGALSTPCGFDWDGDGEEDIIAGNSAGEIAFIKNLGGGKAWDAPKLFTVGGKPFRIMAGENGSIQGPAECKWGYTVLSVADWDGDGKADIIINSIWGKIQWMKGLGGLKMSAPKPVTVAWEGEIPKPKWNWWKPEPGTLATQWRTTPVAIDWNKDGRMDLIVLDTEGYPAYFERLADGRLAPGKRIFRCKNGSVYDARSAGSTNNPRTGMKDKTPGILRLNELEAGQSGRRKICLTDWDKDGYLDLIVDGRFGAAWFRGGKEQNGLYPLEYKGAMSSTRLEGHTTCPTPVDWDKDGIYDILVGAEDGHFYILKNTMTNYSERIALYPEGTYPVEESIDEKGYIWGKIKPEILVYRPENPTGAAVLIVPGGGYEKNCITFEGYKTTELFLRYGITAFILKYRLPEGRPETTLEDGEAAIRLIRSRAEEFGINPHKVGIMGFSAGGHFCSSILTKFSSEETRPDFGILVYPVISYEYDNAGTHARLLGDNLEKDGPAWTATNNIRDDMPPVMLLACEDDRTVPIRQLKDFYDSMAARHLPVQMHLYPTGGHGFWMKDRFRHKKECYPLVVNWIKDQ
jgi:acetyl esterase/lipase